MISVQFLMVRLASVSGGFRVFGGSESIKGEGSGGFTGEVANWNKEAE